MEDKKKLNKKDFKFRKIDDQTLVKTPGQIRGIDFKCIWLNRCTVYLCDYIATIYIDDCVDCTFYIGPVVGSIFMRDCKNCTLSVAAAQVRISKCEDIKLFSFCQSDPTLEKVTGLEVAPYNFKYPKVAEHFTSAKLDVSNDRWNQVADFTKTDGETHWKVMDPENWPGMHVKELEGFEDSDELPTLLPAAYGGDLEIDIYAQQEQEVEDENPGGIQSFAIGTDEQKAWDAVEKGQPEPEDPIHQDEPGIVDFLGGGNTETFGENNTFQTQESVLLEEQSNQSTPINQQNLAASSSNNNMAEEDPLAAKLRARETDRQNQLQKLYADEVEEKKQRRSAAQEYLLEFMASHQQTLIDKKNANQQNNQNKNTGLSDEGESWQKIKSNIGEKASDYPGNQDVNRFRESILNKASDGTN